jgi:hypothetical protein
MTREHIAGFLMGISVGTAVGFFLQPPESHRREIDFAGIPSGPKKALEPCDPHTGIIRPAAKPVASVSSASFPC